MEFVNKIFAVFGVDVSIKDEFGGENKIFKRLSYYFLRITWDVVLFFQFFVVLFGSSSIKVYSVHVMDLLMVNFLRYLMHRRMKMINILYKNLKRYEGFTDGKQKRTLFYIYAYCCSQMTMNLISLTRHLSSSEMRDHYTKLICLDMCSISKIDSYIPLKVFFAFMIVLGVCVINLTPALMTVTCYIMHLRIYEVIKNFRRKVKTFVSQKAVVKESKYLVAALAKTKSSIKDLNDELSLILLVLIVFSSTSIFFELSVTILKPSHRGLFSTILEVLYAINYATQFIILICLVSRIEREAFEIKSIIFDVGERGLENLCVPDSKANIIFFALALDNATHQISITAWGLFKINKNLVLVTLGIIITYEVLIIQFMERTVGR